MEPTIGRIVYYRSPQDVIQPAIITGVFEDAVDLMVFSKFSTNPVCFVYQGNELGKWDWMPYQKGQAAKTEELEKVVLLQAEAPKFDCWRWLKSWVDAYENQVGDGKAQEFLNWVNQQPTQAG